MRAVPRDEGAGAPAACGANVGVAVTRALVVTHSPTEGIGNVGTWLEATGGRGTPSFAIERAPAHGTVTLEGREVGALSDRERSALGMQPLPSSLA